MSKLVAYFTALFFLFPQLSQAQAAGAIVGAVEKLGAKSFSAGFTKYGDLTYKLLDEKGNIVKVFQIPVATKEVLEASKPSKVAEVFKRLKNSPSAGQIIKSQLMRFPMETFTFFVALGAMAVRDVVFKYPDNPLAVEQFIASQKDPIGQVSFAAFMMTNGLVSQPLYSITDSKKMHKFIPYLGMSAGMLASHVVSEIGHFPGLAKCLTGKSVLDCDEAHKAWVEYNFKKKGLELIPSFAGLIGSTLVMGLLETGVVATATKVATMSTAVAVRVVAINMALTLNPAGWITVAGRVAFWGYHVVQIAGFMEATYWIEIPFRYHWNNRVSIGPDLTESYQHIFKLISEGRLVGKNPSGLKLCDDIAFVLKQDCQKDLPEEILRFSGIMKEWRDNIAMKPMMAHNAWVQNLAQLATGYNYSKKFYETFVSDVWESQFKKTADLVDMKRSYPLFGVNTINGKVEIPNYLTLQEITEEDQMKHIENVARELTYYLAVNASWLRGLPELDKNAITSIKENLRSKEINKVAQALVVMNHITGFYNKFASNRYQKPVVELMNEFRKKLGDPNPVLVAGQGYLKSLELLMNSDGMMSPYQNSYGSIWFNTSLEYLILQMLIGPDVSKGDSVIKNHLSGFAAEFIPPRIRIDGSHMVQQIVKPDIKNELNWHQINTIFNYKPTVTDGKNQISDQNIFAFLSNNGINPIVLGGQSKTNVSDWWKLNVENQYIEAWHDYEEKYLDIIKDFDQVLWQRYSEFSNKTGFANGLVDSLRQERQIYLNILSALPIRQELTLDLKRRMTNLENKITIIEKHLSQIRLDNGSRTQFISRISSTQVEQAHQEAIASLNQLSSLFDTLKTQSRNEVATKAAANLKITLKENIDTLAAYTNVVNSVSYKERYESGTDRGAKCNQTKQVKTAGQLIQALDCHQ